MKEALPIEVEILPSSEAVAEAYRRMAGQMPGRSRAGRLVEAHESAAEIVAGSAREMSPHWRGDLLASIESEVVVEGDELAGVVYSDRHYAPYQERGTDPYWPNIAALAPWADDHGVSPYIVARAIASRGLEPQKYFEGALRDNVGIIYELIGDSVGEVIEATLEELHAAGKEIRLGTWRVA